MDDSENVERLIFFEQYLFKLKSEKAEFFNEIVERLLSQHLELPFVEDCRKLFVKETGQIFTIISFSRRNSKETHID